MVIAVLLVYYYKNDILSSFSILFYSEVTSHHVVHINSFLLVIVFVKWRKCLQSFNH